MKRISVDNITDAFTRALATGNEKAAWGVVNRAIGEGLSVTEAYEAILLPALAALSRNASPSGGNSNNGILEAVEGIIARLQTNLPSSANSRRNATVLAIGDNRAPNPLLGLRARALADLLACDGWRVSLSASPEQTDKPLDALVLISGGGLGADEMRNAVKAALISLRPPCAILIAGGEHGCLRDLNVRAVADEHEARLALRELRASNPTASGTEESIARQFAVSFESADVLLCIIDEDQKVLTANRVARDQFGFTPGESVLQYLDAGSRQMFEAMLRGNAGATTELVEVGFLRHGQPYLADILLMPCGKHRAMIAYPKQEEVDRLTKILNNYNGEINKLNREVRDLRGQLKQQASALESANAQLGKAFDEIHDTRLDDPLTGAFNKKYYTVNLVNEINRARRYQRSLGFLLVGVDNFDAIAKDIGRASADEILRHVVNLISRNTRQGIDWIARAGDHEFVVVLPETDMDGCLRVGEKLRTLVAGAEIELNGKKTAVTISVGGASYDAMQDVPVSFQELTARAGRALGRARRQGTNRQNIEPLE